MARGDPGEYSTGESWPEIGSKNVGGKIESYWDDWRMTDGMET